MKFFFPLKIRYWNFPLQISFYNKKNNDLVLHSNSFIFFKQTQNTNQKSRNFKTNPFPQTRIPGWKKERPCLAQQRTKLRSRALCRATKKRKQKHHQRKFVDGIMKNFPRRRWGDVFFGSETTWQHNRAITMTSRYERCNRKTRETYGMKEKGGWKTSVVEGARKSGGGRVDARIDYHSRPRPAKKLSLAYTVGHQLFLTLFSSLFPTTITGGALVRPFRDRDFFGVANVCFRARVKWNLLFSLGSRS